MNKKRKILLYVIALIASLTFIFVVAFMSTSKEKQTKDSNNVIKQTKTKEVTVEEKTELEIAQEEYDAKLEKLNSMNLSKLEWFKQYKSLVEEYGDILGNKPKTIYDSFTQQELDLLFKVVQAEIGGYSFDQKCNVVSVIYNRLKDGRFPNQMSGILVGHQFSTISNGAIYKVKVDETTVLACEYVYIFGDTTNGALFFDSNGRLNYMFLFNDGAHNFYTKRK